MFPPNKAPATPPIRWIGVDLARSMAVMAMVIVNFRVLIGGDDTAVPWITPMVDLLFGRAATLFMLLAGVGIALSANTNPCRKTPSQIRRRLVRRGIWLSALGVMLLPWWDADILHVYGVFFFPASLMTNSGQRGLMGLAIGIWLFGVPVHLLAAQGTHPSANGYWSLISDFLLFGHYPLVPWLGLLALGIWVGRRDLSDPRNEHRLIFWGTVLVILAESTGTILRPISHPMTVLTAMRPFPMTPLFALSGTGSALAALGGCLWIGRHFGVRIIIGAMATLGRISLSAYLGHIAFGLILAQWLDRTNTLLDARASTAIAGGLIAFLLASAWIWLRRYDRGPVEALLNRFS